MKTKITRVLKIDYTADDGYHVSYRGKVLRRFSPNDKRFIGIPGSFSEYVESFARQYARENGYTDAEWKR